MMDILIPALLVLGFIGFLVLIPLLIIKARAKINSAEITSADAWKLYLRKSARKPVFQALSIAQLNNLPITLDQIETHWLATGNPAKLMAALAENYENRDVTFQNLAAIDLAGKDIGEAIKSSKKIFEVSVREFPLKAHRLDYSAKYKFGLFSVFGDADPKVLEQKVREKLSSFSKTWDSQNPIKTRDFIQTNILNTEYWEKVLNAQLIDQTVHIKI